MGPFPHDAPRAEIGAHNPMGTDGFGFVEYAHPEPEKLHALFRQMGFTAVARHRTKRSTLYRQGDINYLLTEEPGSHAARFAERHGPSVPSMAFRVVDAQHAYRRALELGAEPADPDVALEALSDDEPVLQAARALVAPAAAMAKKPRRLIMRTTFRSGARRHPCHDVMVLARPCRTAS